MNNNKEFDTEEPTKPVPNETMTEISEQHRLEIACSDRPTVDIRRRPSVRAKHDSNGPDTVA